MLLKLKEKAQKNRAKALGAKVKALAAKVKAQKAMKATAALKKREKEKAAKKNLKFKIKS